MAYATENEQILIKLTNLEKEFRLMKNEILGLEARINDLETCMSQQANFNR